MFRLALYLLTLALGLVRYDVTRRRPTGRTYHGPGSLRRLWLYHRANSLRGIRLAAAQGHAYAEIDVRRTATPGVWVGSHSDDAQGKEGFRARGVPRRLIRHLTWPQIARLLSRDHYRIQRIERMFAEAARQPIGLALDIKTRMTPADADYFTALANKYRLPVYAKYDGTKPWLVAGGDLLHERGWWTRPNNTTDWRAPA